MRVGKMGMDFAGKEDVLHRMFGFGPMASTV